MPPPSTDSKHSRTEIRLLHNVIDSTTPDRLRAVLKGLSATSPANVACIQGELMLKPGALKRHWSTVDLGDLDDADDSDEPEDRSEDSGSVVESDYSDAQTNAPTRRQRFEICKQCDEEYKVLLNDRWSCVWHPGELEVDWEGGFWADHEENIHGEIDNQDMREVYPEGFMYTCCDELGSADGCKTSRHRPNRAKRAKKS
ncbi:hypothetical protein GMOD_00002765 [Pyrenophora seminiperda CCB06]|uniref:Uncharacterized protein n=1 Tax=Pyrenophora seminiperda CCB06 TaxID=1302712 RepID=A0A3M7M382_9PLEO|nr:hypothetical protein GMOD_00002765 [Pyrenophora seminiperda CCB06]